LFVQRVFFKAQEAQLLWNSTGSALLVCTHTDIDKTGKSYYGETGLYFLQSDGKFESNIILKKEGPIHHCSWSPTGKEFLVIYGFMPARVTLFNLKCEPLVDFGDAARNTAKWSPSGKLLCVAGFGNLQGHVDFWDVKKTSKIASAQADFTSFFDWSPNGTCLLTAVLFPRMRVDNEYKIWSYDGKLIHKVPVKDELYEVVWKPVPSHLVSKLAAPPPNIKSSKEEVKLEVKTPPSNPGKYVHPNAKGSISNTSKNEPQGPVIYKKDNSKSTGNQKDLPPGYDFADESKTKKKGKKGGAQQKQPTTKQVIQPILQIEEPEFD